MFAAARPRPSLHLLAILVLAYVLALNGMLGSISAGAHVAEARTAAQLGVICTIHGMTGNETGGEGPTPGKPACIEHCVLAATNSLPMVPASGVAISRTDRLDQVAITSARDEGRKVARASTPPPPRGPPRLI